MQKYNRFVAVILVLCLSISMTFSNSFASEFISDIDNDASDNASTVVTEKTDDNDTCTITGYDVNPIYADVVDVDTLDFDDCDISTESTDLRTFGSEAMAAKYLRSEMKKCNTQISFIINMTYYSKICNSIFDISEQHNGEPDEGDYIYGNWNSYKFQAQYTPSNPSKVKLTFYINYTINQVQTQQLNNTVASIVSSLNLKSTAINDYDKIKAIHDYLCQNVTYDHTTANYAQSNGTSNGSKIPYTAYGALINHTCVCAGYAQAFYRLALEARIDNRIISSEQLNHAWNLVNINDKYYYIDVTWDDNDKYNTFDYDYFLKGHSDFYKHDNTDAKFYTYSVTDKTYTIAYSGFDNSIENARISMNLPKNTQTVSVQSSFSKSRTDGDFNLNAKTDGNGTLKYTSNNTNIVSVDSNGTVTIKRGGTATITVYATETYTYAQSALVTITIRVSSKANTMKVLTSSKTYRASKLSKSSKSFKIKVKKAKGKVTYKSDSSYISVTSSGKVKIKRGTPTGTYKVTVTAAGNSQYSSKSKTVKIKIK